MITIWFSGWISEWIVSLQPDTDIQKLPSNENRIRISEMLFLIFRGFRLLEKVAHSTIIHLVSSRGLTSFLCNWKLTSLNFVKISVDCDCQDTVPVTPFHSHLLCAATGVQTLFIIIRVHHIA